MVLAEMGDSVTIALGRVVRNAIKPDNARRSLRMGMDGLDQPRNWIRPAFGAIHIRAQVGEVSDFEMSVFRPQPST